MSTEILTTLITVIITGFVTLFAVQLTNRANYKKLLLQTELEREFKTKEIVRVRLEELYLITDVWLNANVTNWLPYQKVMLGELTYDQALDFTIKQGGNNKYEFNRIKMLIDLYFSSIRKEYDELIAVQNRIVQILETHKREYKKGNLNGLKFIDPMLSEQKIFTEKSAILMQSITALQKII